MQKPSSKNIGPTNWNTERIIGISAIIVSACALIVSILQTRIMQSQQEKAAWPHVRWYTESGWDMDSSGVFKITIVNKGIGPAIIKHVDIVYDNQTYSHDSILEVIQKMYPKSLNGIAQVGFDQTVMLPNDIITFFEITNPGQAAEFAKIYTNLIEDSDRFYIKIEYQDVYNNTFMSTNKTKL